MIVVVAEKPSVGREIARVLGCRERGESCLKNEKYLVTWAVGHLVTLQEPDEMDAKYKRWRMEDLPILPETIPTKVIAKTRKQYQIVKKYINDASTESLICATDAGREGELIFRLIYEEAKCKKPVQRLWISSMTDAAIREGFETLKPASDYDGLYRSAKCRSLADWLVGMNASRAFTIRYHVLLSVGRVQTPTLAILVKRAGEIAAFKPEDYYTLTADLGDFTAQWFDPNAKDEKTAARLPDEKTAKEKAAKIKGKTAKVISVTHEDKRDLAPQLFDLTSLQREANQKLGLTADKTLKLTQELYEKWKAVTYPRTDSKYLPMDMIPRLKPTFEHLPEPYRGMAEAIPRKDGKLPVSKRVFDNSKVSDHHAIIPTPQTAKLADMPPETAKVFDLIARRTVAAFYPPFEYDAVKVIAQAEGESLKATGRVVKDLGWKAVYTDESPKGKAKKEEDKALPDLHEGDTREVQKTTVKKETTKPPSPHTDASLLYAMENAGRDLDDEALREQMKGSGLGTPATRAAMIERLLQVGYAKRRGKVIEATEKGVQLISIVPPEIASPETTGRWELALQEIAEDSRDTERFMQGIRKLSAFLTEYAVKTDKEAQFAPEERKGRGKTKSTAQKINAVCALCGREVQETPKAFGCSDWKNGCRFTLWKDCLKRGGGPELNARICEMLLKDGRVAGSTGTITLEDGTIAFTPKGKTAPDVRLPIVYEKKTGG